MFTAPRRAACFASLKNVKHLAKGINLKKAKHGGKRKGAGRPATGKAPMRGVRMSDSQVAEVESWARRQPDKPGFSEAVRRLVAWALERWK